MYFVELRSFVRELLSFSLFLSRVLERGFSFSLVAGPTEAKTPRQEQNRVEVQLYTREEGARVENTLGMVSGNVITKPRGAASFSRLREQSQHRIGSAKLCVRFVPVYRFFAVDHDAIG